MKIFGVATVLVAGLCAPAALGSELPRFDVQVHCKNVSDLAGGSEQIYGYCFDQEQSKYDALKLRWAGVDEPIQRHCGEVAQMAGGSYQILQYCVNAELAARGENSGKAFEF